MTKIADKIVSEINNVRKREKGHWYYGEMVMGGKIVRYKGYGLWLQYLIVDGITCVTTYCSTVKQFKEEMKEELLKVYGGYYEQK